MRRTLLVLLAIAVTVGLLAYGVLQLDIATLIINAHQPPSHPG